MHIILPLPINADTHFTYPQRDGGLSQPPARLGQEWVLNPGPVTWWSTALPTELSQMLGFCLAVCTFGDVNKTPICLCIPCMYVHPLIHLYAPVYPLHLYAPLCPYNPYICICPSPYNSICLYTSINPYAHTSIHPYICTPPIDLYAPYIYTSPYICTFSHMSVWSHVCAPHMSMSPYICMCSHTSV